MKNKFLYTILVLFSVLCLVSCRKTATPTPTPTPTVDVAPVETYKVIYYTFNKTTDPTTVKDVTNLPDELPVLEVEGYTFEGWFYDINFTNEAKAGDALEKNVTLYAKFVAIVDNPTEGTNEPTVDNPTEGTDEPTVDNPTEGTDEPTVDNPTEGTDEPTIDNPTQGGGDEPTQGDDLPDQLLTLVENPEINKAYKLSFYSTAKSTSYYFIGSMNQYYGASSTNPAEGVDVKLESVTGGYNLYFLNSSNKKQYINIETSGTHINFVFGDTATTVWTWDSSLKALVGEHDGTTYFIGTFDNYVTFGMAAIDKANSSYVAQLFIYNPNASGNGGSTDEPTEGGDTGNTPAESEIQKVLDEAANLAANATLTGDRTLTGTIKTILEPYTDQYQNISFILTDGVADIEVHRGKGTGIENLAVGDTVTVTGTIKNYNGEKIEFDKPSLVVNSSGNQGGVTPDTPVVDALKTVVFVSKEEVYVSGKTYSISATNIPTDLTVEYVGNNVTGAGNHLVTANFYDSENNLVGTLYAYIKVVYQVEFPEI